MTSLMLQHPVLDILGDEGERPEGDMPRAGLTTACTYHKRPAAWGCAAVHPWQGTHCLPAGIQEITDTQHLSPPHTGKGESSCTKIAKIGKKIFFFFPVQRKLSL